MHTSGNFFICGLLVICLIECVIETKVVDLHSDYILYFATIFFIAIDFFLENWKFVRGALQAVV